ncbi:MAG: CotH kinase family protein [Clostridia bacterium]|nr:CotH kinase family protein [Clostridia bacterium]
MKKLLCTLLAVLMTAAVCLPAAALAEAAPRDGAYEYAITPDHSDGVTLEYDAEAFTLSVIEEYGMLRIAEDRTLTLTASFDEGWTYSANYSNFFRAHADRVTVADGENGTKVFTFNAVAGDYMTEDELQTVGIYASAAELPKFYVTTEIPFSQIGKDEYVAASFELTLGTKQYASGNYSGTGSIKGRGNTSWGQPKKPYSIKLDSKKSLLDIPKTKKYAIIPSYSDPSLIRNYLTYKSGLMLDGIGYVPKCEFVEVYLNGSYNGIYLLVERVSIESNKIDIEEANADELTGGYLIEKDISGKIDFSEDQWFNCPYWANQDRDYFVLKEPEPDDANLLSDMLSYLTNYMQALHNAIMGTSGEAYTKYVDTPSWIDFIIVQELAKNIDGNLKTSCYMYKQAQDDHLYMTAPWDFDLAYGNPETTWNNADHQHNDYYDCPDAQSPADFMTINSSCPWFDHLYDDHEEFRAALMEKYAEYRRSMIPFMLRTLDSQGAYLYEAAVRNDNMWGKNFNNGVSSLRNWFTSRVAWLDGQWLPDQEPIDLDFALNTEGGSLTFTTSQHSFTGTIKDSRIAGVSGNAGADSSTSSVTVVLDMQAGETLSFDYKVSSEQGYDKFSFNVNGSKLFEKSGELDWESYTWTAASAGSYTFVWKYDKDYSVSSGSDCVWLDEVAYSGDSGPELLPGDADGNGVVDVTDALMVLRYAMGIIGTLPRMDNADMDGNGTVNVTDAVVILRMSMGVS